MTGEGHGVIETVCYRHPDRPAGVRCQRCDKPICPACMNSAAVGFQCPSCFNEGVKSIPRTRTSLGGVARGNTPIVTFTMLALNVLVFIVVRTGSPRVVNDLVLVPVLVDTEPWRLLTSAYTHVQIFHIFSNLFMLYVVGPPLEQMLGRLRFTVLYVLSALGGSVAVWLLGSPISATLGASGAVLGLVGALLVISRARGLDVTWIIAYVAITAVISFTIPNISWQGHLGGFVTGAAVAWIFLQDTKRRRSKART
ncbi:membrane associated rhomboid family serine protease [Kribbella orskensis]|uniref:Membrane associated rhomboid family serine protease n=1 Tax=Kribbella orskensis TaxID=2512216 RepID=A0ABY2BQN0_9ACTN|nr:MULTISPECIES: rhomboid family intramembrane serine protease [Kribbella]TCN39605.1 membrane associated rhomboid family serine protease [Kribbella sp. VKM Ac-2500]TCO27613.1 membrane associated rhomboid family serine protease [Kribbella orskensis]